ncbi:MAG: NAD(P)-dependent oxidoreductase [Spirochaetaceae bacterium]|nr:NAD(P)-dependent oxidoreductase [Spirochaetaceae bacterium]
MRQVGLVGVGDMGIGLAANLIEAGYPVTGFDLRAERLAALEELGGSAAASVRAVGARCDAVFVMVLNGAQVQAVAAELLEELRPGATIIVTATITPDEMRAVLPMTAERQVHLVDCPVSGGKAGADAGTLTLMAAAPAAAIEANRELLDAIGSTLWHVGEEVGAGQTVKAALQVVIGANYAAIFEALVLGVKAGVPAQTLYDVIGSTAVGGPLFRNCASLIMQRRFRGTGSHLGTMYKDLCISMDVARANGVPMFTAAAAKELFQAGIARFPGEDNWAIVKILEELAGTEVRGAEEPRAEAQP